MSELGAEGASPEADGARIPDTDALPPALQQLEDVLVGLRRDRARVDRSLPRVGLALSGGGIRSATFCLGVLQALAAKDLLRRVDFLSTVSGGGYTGAFLSALHLRSGVGPDEVRAILSRDDAAASAALTSRNVLGWLRENGRHLAPNGAGDLATGVAILLRNWLSVQFVMLLLAFTAFTVLQALRAWIETSAGGGWSALQDWLQLALPLGTSALWWSVWVVVPVVVVLAAVVPLGWAYWLIALPRKNPLEQMAPAVAVVIVLFTALILGRSEAVPTAVPATLGGMCVMVIAIAIVARISFPDNGALRRRLSEALRDALVLTAVAALIALVDTAGQSAYLFYRHPNGTLSDWLVEIGGATAGLLAAAAAGARRLTVALSGTAAVARPRLPVSVLAIVAAIVVYGVALIATNGLSHAVAWRARVPADAPAVLVGALNCKDPRTGHESCEERNIATARAVARARERHGYRPLVSVKPAPVVVTGWAILLMLLCVVVSWSWSFLNRSTLLPLYTARLVRAYLGASNPSRLRAPPPEEDGGSAAPVTMTRVLPDDDPGADLGWPLAKGPEHGAPLHLINVTVNETVPGRSQIQSNDRRGMGLAVGPAGLSAGRRHHVVWSTDAAGERHQVRVFPRARPQAPPPFRMFEYPLPARRSLFDRGLLVAASMLPGTFVPTRVRGRLRSIAGSEADERLMTGERLGIGQWMGISGAAFSTGLGYRTRIGLSLLAGFFNVRLGYWWDSGVDPASRGLDQYWRKSLLGRAFTTLLPVQSFLVDEFIARFHGPSRRWWYLTDGGHFENMGGYELIRRRLPLVIVVDAEADPEYRFEGLGNLVRKARIDFGAEIRFLDVPELREKFPEIEAAGGRESLLIGSLEMLRRGARESDRIPDADAERTTVTKPDRARLSFAHAALAEVRYRDTPDATPSLLIYLKPTLTGDEPVDLDHYHAAEPDFPQQTTADQFFDEAQWESYRELGEHIAMKVFARRLDPFVPRAER